MTDKKPNNKGPTKKTTVEKLDVKKPVGRPVLFKTADELQIAIDRYFGSISRTIKQTEIITVNGEPKEVPVLDNNGDQLTEIVYVKRPGIIDMCLYIGFSRETLLEYEKKSKYFSDTITHAREKILAFKLDSLYTVKNPRGVMFDLNCNYGMVEKTQQDIKMTATVGVQILDDIE